MSNIQTYLNYINSKIWAKDVRQAIVDAISECYDDVTNPTLLTEGIDTIIQQYIDDGTIDGAILEDLGILVEPTSNIFDCFDVAKGLLSTSGVLDETNSSYASSGFIEVTSGTTYYFANVYRRVFYNSSQEFVSYASNPSTFTPNANGYIRVSVTNANRTSAKVNAGANYAYRPGRSAVDYNLRDDVYRRYEIDNLFSGTEKTEDFDQGYYLSSDGITESTATNYIRTSKYIPVPDSEHNVALHLNFADNTTATFDSVQVFMYQADKKYLGYYTKTTVNSSFLPRENCSYIRLNIKGTSDIVPSDMSNVIVRYIPMQDEDNPVANMFINLFEPDNDEYVIDDFIEDEYISTQDGLVAGSRLYIRAEKVLKIEEGAFYYTANVTGNTYLSCFDEDFTWLGNAYCFCGTNHGTPTPTGAKYAIFCTELSEAPETPITLTKIDGSGIVSLCAPYATCNEYIYYTGTKHSSSSLTTNSDYNCICIPNVSSGDKIYTSRNVDINAVFFNASRAVISYGSSYESKTPIGRVYTVPANAVYVYLNINNETDAVTGELNTYITILKDSGKELQGKSIAVIGDSITWLDGRGPYGTSNPMIGWQAVLRKLGADVDTFAYSGRSYAKHVDSIDSETGTETISDSIYEQIVENQADLSAYDAVVLFGGANDVRVGITMGDASTTYSSPNLDPFTFYGAVGAIIEYIRTNNPTCKIFICTTLPSEAAGRPYTKNKQYRDAIINSATFYSVSVIDLFALVNVSPTLNFSTYFYDSTHPNIKGQRRIGEIVAQAIVDNI